jgi:hypothetical protein
LQKDIRRKSKYILVGYFLAVSGTACPMNGYFFNWFEATRILVTVIFAYLTESLAIKSAIFTRSRIAWSV